MEEQVDEGLRGRQPFSRCEKVLGLLGYDGLHQLLSESCLIKKYFDNSFLTIIDLVEGDAEQASKTFDAFKTVNIAHLYEFGLFTSFNKNAAEHS